MSDFSAREKERSFQITLFQFGVVFFFFFEGFGFLKRNLDIFEAIQDRNYGGERFQYSE